MANGRDVLSAAQVEELAKYLTIIQGTFTVIDATITGKAVDVEFLVDSSGRVVIVQARPFTVTWKGDRRWMITSGITF